ncbi:hypothetical protein [Brevibacillus sp. SYSU BS000544]|uniref:hypothetical protein n=1 Tax=Brevibacillus sp. SYSU BS000544 TaxID=3416443 RepID=UPI003CE4FBB7
MKIEEINRLAEDGNSPVEIKSVEIKEDNIVVNGKIALPIEVVSNYYTKENDIVIFDEDGNEIGCLCLKRSFDISELSDYRFVAYLIDVDYNNFLNTNYEYNDSYVVINEEFYDDYIQHYKDTSSLWGKFSHEILSMPVNRTEAKILAIKNINLPTKYHIENCIRAINEPYAFERFLKLYHLLELIFDYDLVQDIKALNEDIKDAGKLIMEYKREDINRLKWIFEKRLKNLDQIVSKLNHIQNYMDKAYDIFYHYGKESNPIKKYDDFEEIIKLGGFEYSQLKQHYAKNYGEEQHKQFIINVAAYWIYRIRCCIAHNKIGEYIMESKDEEFVNSFAEPLLYEILIEGFRVKEYN